MNRSTIVILAAAALLFLAGCDKVPGPADDGLITVDVSIGAPTKVAYDGDKASFAAGDRIAVYAWQGSADAVPAKRVVDGVVNTLGSDGKWTPASLMRWKYGNDAHYFLGISPVHDITDFTADPYTLVPADLAASDLLFAANLDGVTAADGAVKLSFAHAMAKLNVNLNFRSQWASAPKVGAVTLDARKQGSINYLTGVVTATGDASSVEVPATTAASAYARSYSGLQVPQSGAKKITVTIEGTDYIYEAGEDIPLVSGQITTVNLIVGRDRLELASAIAITDWVDDKQPDGDLGQARDPFCLSAFFPKDLLPFKDAWQAGDVVFVFFSGQATPKYLEMKWNGTAWESTPKNGLSLGASETGTMQAYYLPFGSDATVSAAGTDFAFSAVADCYLTAALPYTVTGGTVQGSFDLGLPDGAFSFFLPDDEAASNKMIELREPHLTPLGLGSVAGDFSVVSGAPAHGAPMKGLACTGTKKGYAFYGTLAEDAWGLATDYRFTLVRDGWQGSYFSYVQTGKRRYVNSALSQVETLPGDGWTAIPDYKPIDLGCDVDDPVRGGKKRVYWSSCNLGASSEFPDADTDEARHATWGDYYAWGETEPYYTAGHAYDNPCDNWKGAKTGYDWTSYRYGDGILFSKYNDADGLITLQREDDVACVRLGGNWRIPTIDELKVIFNEPQPRFSSTWDNTNKGFVITVAEGTAWTDPTIFLPSPGYRQYIHLTNSAYCGFYWSVSLQLDNEMKTSMTMAIDPSGYDVLGAYRSLGQSIRPVTD